MFYAFQINSILFTSLEFGLVDFVQQHFGLFGEWFVIIVCNCKIVEISDCQLICTLFGKLVVNLWSFVKILVTQKISEIGDK